MALTKTKINLGTEGNLSGSRSLLGIENTLVSSSAQLASSISGSFTDASSSFSTRVSNLKTDSGSFSTRITAATSSISALKTDSGSLSTRVLNLKTDIVYQGIQQALHTTISTRTSRKGEIYTWKAFAPAHAGKLAIEVIDRAMRGEGAPSPIYEG